MKTETIFNRIMSSELCRIDGKEIDLCDSIIDLCEAIENEEKNDWFLGEGEEFALDSFIVGAYWALSEWHAGQWSTEYQALCALGSIYSPNMSAGVEPGTSEHTAYDLINEYFKLKTSKTQ